MRASSGEYLRFTLIIVKKIKVLYCIGMVGEGEGKGKGKTPSYTMQRRKAVLTVGNMLSTWMKA